MRRAVPKREVELMRTLWAIRDRVQLRWQSPALRLLQAMVARPLAPGPTKANGADSRRAFSTNNVKWCIYYIFPFLERTREPPPQPVVPRF